ncbi:MAG: hypothetical protein AAFQ65_12300 [Myxococcota bacterium]
MNHSARHFLLLTSSAALLMSGCFEVEQKITIKRNMSGTAAMDFKMDMEPMVYMMAFMRKAMAGGGENAEVTPADFKAAKKQFIDGQGEDMKTKMGQSKKDLIESLPEGVKLERYKAKNGDLNVDVAALLSFDHVKKLSQIDMDTVSPGPAAPGGAKADSGPFGGLNFKEDARTFSFSTKFDNPAAAQGSMGGMGEGGPENLPGKTGQVIRKALDRASFKVSIDAPFKVLEHNATQVRGSTLIWKFDYKAMKALQESGKALEIMARFAK